MKKKTIRMTAPAKTNLHLRVLGLRSDSRNEIETLFHPVRAVADELELAFLPGTEGLALECETPGVPCDGRNLCCKAATAYFKRAGIAGTGLRIVLHKHIPVAAGMGGGSSDAAAVLLALESEFGALGKETLQTLAAELGSDVPFFLDPVDSVGRGGGELLERLDGDTRELPLLFAAPGFPVSAKWAYTHIDREACAAGVPSLEDAVLALRANDMRRLRAALRNDLEHAVFRKFPILGAIGTRLADSGGSVLLSGSGPTVLALYDDFETCGKAFSGNAAFFADWRIRFFKG